MVTKLDPNQDFSMAVPPSANLLTNGGLEVWQRGTSFSSPANFSLTADRWNVFSSQPTLTVSREASIFDTGTYSMKVVVTGTTGSNRWTIYQSPDGAVYPAGTPFSGSVRVFSSVPNSIRLEMGASRSSYHPGDGTWRTLTISGHTPSPSNPNQFNFGFGAAVNGDAVNGTFYFDSAMLVVGSQPVNFVPMHPADDLARCMRYFQVIGGALAYLATGANESTTRTNFAITLPVAMRIPPVVSVNNPTNFQVSGAGGGLINCTVVGTSTQTLTNVVYIQTQVASGLVAGNAANFYSGTSNATVFLTADY